MAWYTATQYAGKNYGGGASGVGRYPTQKTSVSSCGQAAQKDAEGHLSTVTASRSMSKVGNGGGSHPLADLTGIPSASARTGTAIRGN